MASKWQHINDLMKRYINDELSCSKKENILLRKKLVNRDNYSTSDAELEKEVASLEKALKDMRLVILGFLERLPYMCLKVKDDSDMYALAYGARWQQPSRQRYFMIKDGTRAIWSLDQLSHKKELMTLHKSITLKYTSFQTFELYVIKKDDKGVVICQLVEGEEGEKIRRDLRLPPRGNVPCSCRYPCCGDASNTSHTASNTIRCPCPNPRNTSKRFAEEDNNGNMKRRKQQAPQGLDHLPDEILVCILSRLSLKEAVRTSALSRRWRTLWRFTSGSLDFDFRDAKGLIAGTGYERWVSRILELHQGASIERFSACVSPILSRNALIDYWITLVMEKEIKHFELDLSKIDGYTLHLEKFLFILKEARPKKGDLCCLISVSLSNVDVNVELIEYLLSHCPQLENLSLKLSRHVENLKVVSPSMRSLEIIGFSALKSLKVLCPSLKSMKICKCSILEFVEIFAENLVSLSYHGPIMKLELHNVCLLSDLHVGGDFCNLFIALNYDICVFTPRLEKIQLHVSRQAFTWSWYYPNVAHPFLYIKQLELHIEAHVGDELLFFVMLTNGCPVLCELVIKLLYQQAFPMKDDSCTTFAKSVWWELDFARITSGYTDGPHVFLKVVKIINFAACESDFKLAWMLLILAKRLEKMLIRPVETSNISLSEARVRAQKLKHDLPPTAKLVIF